MVKDAMESIYTAVYLTFNAGCHAILSYIAFDPQIIFFGGHLTIPSVFQPPNFT